MASKMANSPCGWLACSRDVRLRSPGGLLGEDCRLKTLNSFSDLEFETSTIFSYSLMMGWEEVASPIVF